MEQIEQKYDDLLEVVYDDMNESNKHETGGDKTLEWYGTTGRSVKRGKRKRGRF